ncbi:MAG: hypothetical protein HYY18_06510 [Planctomycetes bacterium]|nr:hypothetical protein [Planctomycetota bacterium]
MLLRHEWVGAVLLLVGCAQTGEKKTSDDARWGILVLAHGGDADWNEAIEDTIAPLRPNHAVEVAYGMAECRTIQKAIDRLEEQGCAKIAVVRLFVRSESFESRIEYLLGLRESPPEGASMQSDHCSGGEPHVCTPVRRRVEIVLGPALDGDPDIGAILADRALAMSRVPEREVVLLLSHGLGDEAVNARLVADMERAAATVREKGGFRQVAVETLREDWPELREAAEKRIRERVRRADADGLRMIVVPYRVAGFGPYREVLEGCAYEADGRGFCPDPRMTALIQRRLREVEEVAER